MNNLLDWRDARKIVLDHAKSLPATSLPVDDAVSKVLAEDLTAHLDLPPFDNSAVDGYAVRSSDVLDATDAHAVTLRVIGLSAAGSPLSRAVNSGECAQIFTGAAIPAGADSVVMQEQAEVGANAVTFRAPARPGENIRWKGEDVHAGVRILTEGTRFGPAQIGLVASQGLAHVPVFPAPIVSILATGTELAAPGAPLPAGSIYESNTFALRAALKEIGVGHAASGRVADSLEATTDALKAHLPTSRIVIISGGVSVGGHDFVRQALDEVGVKCLFWRIAMRPGKPLYFGIAPSGALVFGLPGNPVSTLVCFYQFIRPALLQIMGHRDIFLPEVEATLEEDITRSPGRFEFMRGICREADGVKYVRSAGRQGSNIYSSFAAANCFILVPSDVTRLAKGVSVTIQLLTAAS